MPVVAARRMADSSNYFNGAVSGEANERGKLERLCRYMSRPAIAEQRLSVDGDGRVVYELKRPFRDGTTHVLFEPHDFIKRVWRLWYRAPRTPTSWREDIPKQYLDVDRGEHEPETTVLARLKEHIRPGSTASGQWVSKMRRCAVALWWPTARYLVLAK